MACARHVLFLTRGSRTLVLCHAAANAAAAVTVALAAALHELECTVGSPCIHVSADAQQPNCVWRANFEP